MNIMLVEDDPVHAELIEKSLARERDLTIERAATIRRARELLKLLPFALALLDYSLPDGTGLELFGEIRAQYATLPIIFLTSFDSAELCARVMKGGAVDYIVKKRNYLEGLPRAVRRALKMIISPSGLKPEEAPRPVVAPKPTTEYTRLLEALEKHHWRRDLAARELAISRITLWRRMWKYELGDGRGGRSRG